MNLHKYPQSIYEKRQCNDIFFFINFYYFLNVFDISSESNFEFDTSVQNNDE